MKTIIVCCGSSMITSSVAIAKIQERLEKEGIQANIVQCKFAEVASNVDQYHPALIIPTGALSEEQTKGVPIVKGTSFVTGINEEATLDKIVSYLK
ncbi:PTS lactose transporter subunit IIB [Erysipelotrichaceae bacterium OH741_COT-311]|nr:PTS lactose transporter subunit IIB [Erysipelotrichaceae bacterium OH741_COT-311]